MPHQSVKNSRYPLLMRRLGLIPEDTEFNRRAAAYAKVSEQRAYYHDCKNGKRPKPKSINTREEDKTDA